MPAYNDTPLATDPINQTQAPIRTNFQSIQQLIDINHVDFSDPVNFGKHTVLSLLAQAASPPLTGSPPANAFGATDVGLYNFVSTVTGLNEIFANKLNNVGSPTPVQIPITASILSTASVLTNGLAGWTYLPSGLIMKWGNTPGIPNSNVAVTVTIPSSVTNPAFTNLFSIQLTPIHTGAVSGYIDINASIVDANKFNAYSSSTAPAGAYYLAIGW
jgi:hypothetical protein